MKVPQSGSVAAKVRATVFDRLPILWILQSKNLIPVPARSATAHAIANKLL